MDGSISEIIAQFASYITQLISYLMDFFKNFQKKDDAAE